MNDGYVVTIDNGGGVAFWGVLEPRDADDPVETRVTLWKLSPEGMKEFLEAPDESMLALHGEEVGGIWGSGEGKLVVKLQQQAFHHLPAVSEEGQGQAQQAQQARQHLEQSGYQWCHTCEGWYDDTACFKGDHSRHCGHRLQPIEAGPDSELPTLPFDRCAAVRRDIGFLWISHTHAYIPEHGTVLVCSGYGKQ